MKIGLAAAAAYIATIVVANYLVQHVGLVSVGFGLHAPAAVYAAGFALTFRDLVQRFLGREAAVVAIVVGSAVSFFVAPSFAVPSAVAFLVSEAADLAVYTPLAERTFIGAVLLSNTVGLVLDSVLFLWLSPLPVEGLLAGQMVGKAWATLFAVALLLVVRRGAVLPRHA